MQLPVALQLYSVRDAMNADLEGTLAGVAKIGFKYVETAGTYGKTYLELRQLLDKHGLTPVAMHTNLGGLTDTLTQTLQDAKDLGVKYIVCAFLTQAQRDYEKSALLLESAAEVAAVQNLVVSYHNHSFELDKDDKGRQGLELLFADTEGKLQAELDIFWVQHAHEDPIAWMKKLAGRLPLLHVKDMDKTEKRDFAEIGTGCVDIAAAVKYAPQAGVKYLIAEQDGNWTGTPLESAKVSFDNLQKILAS